MITDASIGIQTLSDHDPIAISMNLLASRPKSNTWRLNASLKDPALLPKIKSSPTDFFQLNETDVDALVL